MASGWSTQSVRVRAEHLDIPRHERVPTPELVIDHDVVGQVVDQRVQPLNWPRRCGQRDDVRPDCGGSPSMPLAYNLFVAALNVSSIGRNGSAMAVVSGGGPVEDIVADWDSLRGCDGVLLDEQATRIAVSAIATAQHNCRFRMAVIVARVGRLLCASWPPMLPRPRPGACPRPRPARSPATPALALLPKARSEDGALKAVRPSNVGECQTISGRAVVLEDITYATPISGWLDTASLQVAMSQNPASEVLVSATVLRH